MALIFLIGNNTFIERNEHHVHDDEHFEHGKNTHSSRTKASKL